MPRLLLIFVIVLLTASGCSNLAKNGASPSAQNNNQQNNRQVRVQQTVPPKQEMKNASAVAERLEQLALSVPGVRNATTVVIGNTAIVGIDVDGNLDRSRVGTMKYSVAEALRKDPYGVHAVVTADLDIRNRLTEIRKDIRAGRPISGFAGELADMIGRIMPQLPKDIIVPQQIPDNQRSDRKKLNNKSL